MMIVWASNVKKVAHEPSGPVAEVEAPQAENDSSNHSEKVYSNIFITETFGWNKKLCSYRKILT